MLGFVAIIFIALTTPVFSETKYAADCTTPDNVPGSCTPITSCASALNIFRELQRSSNPQKFKFLQDSKCSSVGKVVYICCPQEDSHMHSDNVITHLKKMDCGNMGRKKISKGFEAGLFDYRWMVLLIYEKNTMLCDGTLIDDQHVLTAAHCLHNNTLLPDAVRVGEYNTSTATDCALFGDERMCLDPVEDIPIDTIIPHQDYVFGQIDHDIALIRLQRPVKCTSSIRPICLPITKKLQTTSVDYYTVSGWGNTEMNIRPNVLQFAHLPKQTNKLCAEKFSVNLNDGHICVGAKNFQDTCKGDSGGPLFYPTLYVDNVSRSIQYGIVSAGHKTMKCGARNLPGIYTNVVKYMPWITDHMVVRENAAESSCYVEEIDEEEENF